MALQQTASQDDAPVAEDHDFDAIEAAVLETARGRWFLREFGRRLKAVENERVLEALVRIERLLAESRSAPVAAVASSHKAPVAPAPESSHQVTDLRFAVRLVQLRLIDLASNMRTSGVDAHFCDQIEQQARAFVEIASGRSPTEPVHIPELSRVEDPAPVQEAAPVEELGVSSASAQGLSQPVFAPVEILSEVRVALAPASPVEPDPLPAALGGEPGALLPQAVTKPDFVTAFPELSEARAHPKPPLEPLIRRLPPTSVRFTREAAPPQPVPPAPLAVETAVIEPAAVKPAMAEPAMDASATEALSVEAPAVEAPAIEAPIIALPVIAPRPAMRPPVNPAAFMAIDALSQREKSALFA